MVQTHSMIFWAKAREEDFEVAASRAYAVLTALQKFGAELSPNYLKAMRKKDAETFDGSYKTLKILLRKGINKEGKNKLPELGYRVGFFSSFVDKESTGISILVGTTDTHFKNTVVVNLPQTLPIFGDSLVVENLIRTFQRCVEVFDPFWGCISNNVNVDRFDGYWQETIPTTVHWVNFFGKDIVDRLGILRIQKAPVKEVDNLGGGYLIRLKQTPINDASKADISLQSAVNSYFGF